MSELTAVVPTCKTIRPVLVALDVVDVVVVALVLVVGVVPDDAEVAVAVASCE